MGKIFVTSDTWFNRPIGKMSEYTTNDYNDTIIANWNKVVGKKDIVYILGGLGIGDMYHILVKLNGEIHILNNFYTQDELTFLDVLKRSVELSVDKKTKSKIIFSENQILSIPDLDVILTYLPLMHWCGEDTGTFCFHGLITGSDLINHRISCKLEDWGYKPVSIIDIQNNLEKFRKNI